MDKSKAVILARDAPISFNHGSLFMFPSLSSGVSGVLRFLFYFKFYNVADKF